MSSASVTLTGARLVCTSLSISTDVPPKPHVINGPNWASTEAPTIISVPPETISCTTIPFTVTGSLSRPTASSISL